MFNWYATPQEQRETLPGDELISEIQNCSTYAITIHASPHEVWPWLVQMGCNRGGYYSYDWLDNGEKRSANQIIEEYQSTKVGDILPSRPGSHYGFEVLRMERPHLFLLGAYLRAGQIANLPWNDPPPAAYVRSTWAFVLRESEEGARLIVRTRGVIHPWWFRMLTNMFFVPAHVIMQRKQLLSLRERIETAHMAQAPPLVKMT
ncbi:hypothetical protein DTL42_18145 [Bremerella cremea]|uniref:SRPBCC family protein n=1 Tax=Bremerella cremea TaxID=1031537 RepID=A0A368KR57_9BACT|nr:hypothetical protein [Bremerella cremea]RCS43911.1 hypothetical protein DTL42_18145 [Bremerella cremea]